MTRLIPQSARVGGVLRRHGPAAAAYLLLTLLFTIPLVPRIADAIAGEHVPDTMQNYWNVWWSGYALLELQQNPFHATYIQHPFGLPLLFHTYNFLGGLLTLPVRLCCGVTPAYNASFLIAFVLAGIGAYGLAYALTRQRGAAFVAGLIFAFSPYMAFHLKAGQPFMVAVQWFPFYLWLLLAGLREHWRWLPPAALLLFCIGLTDWHYTVYALLLTGIVGLYELWQRRSWPALRDITWRLALVGGLFALLMAPILVPMFLELAQEEYATRDIRHSIYHSTDLLAFFLPSIFHPLWGEWASAIFYGRLVEPFIAGGMASLGVVPLALALLGALADRRRAALYVIVFVVFAVLALGPYLRVGGWQSADSATPIPLPYLLFRALPFMDIHRIPSRFVAVAMLALALLAAFGVAWLLQRPAVQGWPTWGRGLLLGALALLVLFEYWPRPFTLTPAGLDEIPPFYRTLRADAEPYALLELPDLDARSMFYQTYHRKPIMGGQISRPRGHPWRGARFFDALVRVDPGWQDVGTANSAAAVRAAIRCQGVRYVIVYRREVGEVTRRRIDTLERDLFAGVAPVYEDAIMRVYEVHNTRPDEPYWTLAPREWYAAETLPELDVTGRWSVGAGGGLLIYPCHEQPQQQALVTFEVFGYGVPRTVEVLRNGEVLGSVAVPLGWVREVRLALPLHPGENRIELRSREPATLTGPPGAAGSRPVSFNVSRVEVVAPGAP
jgi:hypothetical protein